MEVCGRYHHWMPIMIRIVHRDAFLSWCLTYLRALNARSVSGFRANPNSTVALQWLQDSQNAVEYNNLLTELRETRDVSLHEAYVEALLK